MISEEEKFKVHTAMRQFGGSFVRALGEALSHADIFNAAKIKATWPDYWEKYLNMYDKARP